MSKNKVAIKSFALEMWKPKLSRKNKFAIKKSAIKCLLHKSFNRPCDIMLPSHNSIAT